MRPVFDDVSDELLPLDLEAVLDGVVVRHVHPVGGVVVGVGQVGVPGRLRGGVARLDPAAEQACDGAAVRAVDLELDELLAVDPHRPAGVELRDHASGQLEHRVGRVVGGRRVGRPRLVDPGGDVRRRARVHRLDATEEVLQHVVPVREHVLDDAAAVFGAVVPARPLGGLPVTFEDPVAELAAHRQDAPEEPGVDQTAQLQQAGQVELVVHHAVLDARGARERGQLHGLLEALGRRLLGVDRLARGDGLADRRGARTGDEEVGVDLPARVGQGGVEVGRVVHEPVPGGQIGELRLAASHQHRLDLHPVPAGEQDTTLLADREDRAHQVLAVAHPSRSAVHDDADALLCHATSPRLLPGKRFPA